jgi:hypothetical protein
LGGASTIGPFDSATALDERDLDPRLSRTLQSTVTAPVGSASMGPLPVVVPELLMITGPIWANAVPPKTGRARSPRNIALLLTRARGPEDAICKNRSAERRIRQAIP